MNNFDRKVNLIFSRLNSVYCDTCKYSKDGDCDDCHRKAMGWGISEREATEIVKLLGEIEGN